MLDYLTRIIFAAIVSGVCFLGTYYWYISNPIEEIVTKEEREIAVLATSENEVQRKPIAKVIWQTVSDNELLRVGDSVRTNSESEARIEFKDSNDVVELEPNSLIILDERDGSLNLEFIKGNILVSGSGRTFNLRSGNRSLSFSGDFSLGKSATSDIMDIQVYKGQVNLVDGNKKASIQEGKAALIGKNGLEMSKNMIEITYPLQRENIYITPGEEERSFFRWKSIDPGYTVQLFTGKTRETMAPLPEIAVSGDAVEIATQIPVGKHYWQIVASHSDVSKPRMMSPISRNLIIAKVPPVLLAPANASKLIIGKDKSFIFRWGNPARLNNLLIEVATDAQMKKAVLRDTLPAGDLLESTVKKPGKYYWRITGYLGRKKEPVSSDIATFTLEEVGKLRPPKLLQPEEREGIPLAEVNEKGVFLKWENVPGVEMYRVSVIYKGTSKGIFNGSNSIEEDTKLPQYRLPTADVGSYSWSVKSLEKSGQVSKSSKISQFRVEALGQLLWADGKDRSIYMFQSIDPEFEVSWKPGPKTTTEYQLRWVPIGQEMSSVDWIKVNGTSFKTGVASVGPVSVEVRALNKAKQVIARSSRKTVVVEMEPRLPAPFFADSLPPQLKAKRNGTADVSWKPVDGAKSYVVHILDAEGKSIKEIESTSLSGSVKSLLPGEYSVSLQSVDNKGRKGIKGTSRPLVVPNNSDVKAPTLKAIQVN